MKNLFIRILCLALCVFAFACSAAMAEAPVFTLDSDGYIIYVSMDPQTEALEIPEMVSGIATRGIAADVGVFAGYPNLKYIKLDVANLDGFANKSLDFSSAQNLECIFTNFEVTDSVKAKFDIDSCDKISQYVDFSGMIIPGASIAYENGKVRLDFPEIDSAGGALNYRVTRTVRGLGPNTSVRFDSNEDYVNFYVDNGMVFFIDNTAEQGQDYFYYIEAMNPFSCSRPHGVRISIPAAKPVEHPVPATGDGANLVLWSALVAMSAIGMALLCKKREVLSQDK